MKASSLSGWLLLIGEKLKFKVKKNRVVIEMSEMSEGRPLSWSVHTSNMLKEIGNNNPSLSGMRSPLIIFGSLLIPGVKLGRKGEC